MNIGNGEFEEVNTGAKDIQNTTQYHGSRRPIIPLSLLAEA